MTGTSRTAIAVGDSEESSNGVSGNDIYGNTGTGVDVGSGATITNNYIFNNEGAGLELGFGVRGVCSEDPDGGGNLNGGFDDIISNNTFYANSAGQISTDPGSTPVVDLKNNVFDAAGSPVWVERSLRIQLPVGLAVTPRRFSTTTTTTTWGPLLLSTTVPPHTVAILNFGVQSRATGPRPGSAAETQTG